MWIMNYFDGYVIGELGKSILGCDKFLKNLYICGVFVKILKNWI